MGSCNMACSTSSSAIAHPVSSCPNGAWRISNCSSKPRRIPAEWQVHPACTIQRSMWYCTSGKHTATGLSVSALPADGSAQLQQQGTAVMSLPVGRVPKYGNAVTSGAKAAGTSLLSRQQQAVIQSQWAHDVLLLDGTNVLHFAQSSLHSVAAYLDSLQSTASTINGQTKSTAAGRARTSSSRQSGSAAACAGSFLAWVQALQAMTQAKEVYIVFDVPHRGSGPTSSSMTEPSTGGSLRAGAGAHLQDRKQLLPSYKEARVQKRERKRAHQQQAATSRSKESSEQQRAWRYMRYAQACQQQLGCKVVWCPSGLEADDVLLTLASLLQAQSTGPSTKLSVAVASSDSDMQQLLALGHHVGWLELLQLPGQLSTPHPAASTSSQAPQQSVTPPQVPSMSTMAQTHCTGGGLQQQKAAVAADAAAAAMQPLRQPVSTVADTYGTKKEVEQPHQQPAGLQQTGLEFTQSADKGPQPAHTVLDSLQADAGHVAAMMSYAWAGTMTWLPVCIHHADQGPEVPAGKLHVSQVADYQALVGKKESGVKGAGLSAKQAVGLLRRYGNIHNILNEYREGRLNTRLQPVKPPATFITLQDDDLDQMGQGVLAAACNLNITQLRNVPDALPAKVLQEVLSEAGRLMSRCSLVMQTNDERRVQGQVVQAGSEQRIQRPQAEQQSGAVQPHWAVQEQHGVQGQQQQMRAVYQQCDRDVRTADLLQPGHAQQASPDTGHMGRAVRDSITLRVMEDWAQQVALRHPVYSLRVHSNEPYLAAVCAGGGPTWLRHWLEGNSVEASMRHQAGSETPNGWKCNHITPEGLMLDLVPVQADADYTASEASSGPTLLSSQPQRQPAAGNASTDDLQCQKGLNGTSTTLVAQRQVILDSGGLGEPAQQREGLLLLGPADFNHEVVSLLKASGRMQSATSFLESQTWQIRGESKGHAQPVRGVAEAEAKQVQIEAESHAHQSRDEGSAAGTAIHPVAVAETGESNLMQEQQQQQLWPQQQQLGQQQQQHLGQQQQQQQQLGKQQGQDVCKQASQAGHENGIVGSGAGWPEQVQVVADILSSHCGPRLEPSHLPHKLKVLLKPEVSLLVRALKKRGWHVLLLPFWELIL